jgi:hypothetical protein
MRHALSPGWLAAAATLLTLRGLDSLHAWGAYSLVAAGLTLLLVGVMLWAFNPATPIGPARLGGLIERVVSVETLAWYVAFGWLLFRGAPATPGCFARRS